MIQISDTYLMALYLRLYFIILKTVIKTERSKT